MLPKLSLVMEFMGNIFTFEKRFTHEALVTGRATATSVAIN